MSVHLLRKEYAINAVTPAIAEIKQHIAEGLVELSAHEARGTLTSYQLTRDRVNRQVDEYIAMRKLEVVS